MIWLLAAVGQAQPPQSRALNVPATVADWETSGFSLAMQPLLDWQSKATLFGKATAGNNAPDDTAERILVGLGIVPTWRFHPQLSVAARLDYRVPIGVGPIARGGLGLFWRTGLQLHWHLHPIFGLFVQGHYIGNSTQSHQRQGQAFPACSGKGLGSQLGMQLALWKTAGWQIGLAGAVGSSWSVCSRPAKDDPSTVVVPYAFDKWQWRWEGMLGPIFAWR